MLPAVLSCEKLPALLAELWKRSCTSEEINKVFSENIKRVWEATSTPKLK